MNKPKSNSLLCPNCRKLISSDESVCPYCGLSRPGSPLKANWWTRGFNNPDKIIPVIIGANVGLFILSLILNLREANFSINPMAFLSPAGSSLSLLGATGRIPIDHLILTVTGIPAIDHLLRWLTLISANYLHGSLLHIVFNMLVLRHIGTLAVKDYGPYRMFVLYTLSGL
nr:rhomboid family intramembrane serine protease [Desulfobacterales bacterium]